MQGQLSGPNLKHGSTPHLNQINEIIKLNLKSKYNILDLFKLKTFSVKSKKLWFQNFAYILDLVDPYCLNVNSLKKQNH